MHIHFPSEHAIGTSSNINDAELHLVHKSADSKVLVIGVRFDLSDPGLLNLLPSPNNRPLQAWNNRPVYLVESGQKQESAQIDASAKQITATINDIFDSLSSPADKVQVTMNSRAINPYVLLQSVLPSYDFYVYEGSFTTPPCTEGVTWVFLKSPIKVEGKAFTKLFKNMLQGISSEESKGRSGKKSPIKAKPMPIPKSGTSSRRTTKSNRQKGGGATK